ncbi:MAG: hypothetical protein V1742_11160 [Pseudomonadota bacterium]
MTLPLKNEFQYFLDHQNELAEQYQGKVLAIKDHTVIGAYDSALEAFRKTSEDHEPGTFLIQHCDYGEDIYTMVLFNGGLLDR